MADPINWTDPCARAAALSQAYYELISGSREVEIRTRTLDAEELVRFQAIDLKTLQVEMLKAQSECAASQGLPNTSRRFAIGLTHRRRGMWPCR